MSGRGGVKKGGPRSEREVREAQLSMAQYERNKRQEQYERELRQAERDAAYRRALHLDVLAALPKALGTAGGTHRPTYNGLRGSKRFVA